MCAQLLLGHVSVPVGDSVWHSGEIEKYLELSLSMSSFFCHIHATGLIPYR